MSVYQRIWLSERKGVYCLIDQEDYSWVKTHTYNISWHSKTPWKYYAKRNIDVARSTVYLHVEIAIRAYREEVLTRLKDEEDGKVVGKYVVDHINGQSLDNRRENLRWVTIKENSGNRIKRYDIPSLDKIEKMLDVREGKVRIIGDDVENIPF